MKRMKQIVMIALTLFVAASIYGCATNSGKSEGEPGTEASPQKNGTIRLATTTSTQDSGLLEELLPAFTAATGYEVDVIAVGSGAAMELGETGEADVLLVHSPEAEKEFVEAGYAEARYNVMYNDFVLVGPKTDPAHIKDTASKDVVAAFQTFADSGCLFISRGDDSGTHKKELSIWEKTGIKPNGNWYISAGQGMGAVLTMADDQLAYTLSDRATWLSYEADTDLMIVCEGDEGLNNQYGVIVVDPSKNDLMNGEGAIAFQTWILSEEAQKLIGDFGKDTYGQALFTPNAEVTVSAE